jgi:L-fuculose-phosphate aldolase
MSHALLPEFQRAGEDLFSLGLAPPGAGNLSVWQPEGVLITRELAPLQRLEAGDLVRIARSTQPPRATPSLDTPIHRAVYTVSGGKAIVHAHPPHAVSLTSRQVSFEPPDLEGRHLLGIVPVVSPRRSVVDLVSGALKDSAVVIVEGHGTYARGASLEEAVHLTAMLEQSARIAWLRLSVPERTARHEAQ